MEDGKVCHLTTVHEPLDDRIYHKECRSLHDAGYQVTIVAQHDGDEVVRDIKIVSIGRARNRFHRMVGLLVPMFRAAVKQRSDVYHFHDPELLFLGVLLKLFLRKKVIYDVHEDYGKQVFFAPYLPRGARRCVSLFVRATEHLCSLFFDGIVTATDDISNKFSYHKRAISVKNYPVASYFAKKTEVGHDNGVISIVYAGSLSRERGLYEMVQALEFIEQPVKLIIYGRLDPDLCGPELYSLKGIGKVELHGWVKHEDVTGALSRYDIGIVCLHPIPNYITALPIKLFEYMAAGLPVVVSNFAILREIVEGSKCGICVDPLDPREIASALNYLIAHPEERKIMGESGKRAIQDRYNWTLEKRKLLDLYQEILQK